jgi:hypothetical protein
VWHNQNKQDKNDWDAVINTVDDFMNLRHCTGLIDDVALWIKRWNTRQAEILAEISAFGRKGGVDMIMTSQRENQIPPEIRDQATEWIVPIIRVRDEREGMINPEDGTGKPVELISLHFDGAKIFKYISDPIIGLEPLMECYSTTQKAINLSEEQEGRGQPTRPGYELELACLEYLKASAPGFSWIMLDGKKVFDIISEKIAIDVVSVNADGNLECKHKNLLSLVGTGNKKGWVPYLAYQKHDGEWRFVKITAGLHRRHKGEQIDTWNIKTRSIEEVIDYL